ncbi:MAG: tRNA (N(6)-L-threonylcarbamoyladenosine(37)-C(2))-methylthiotransferase MtaB, partial [Fidelibacterota bacterium]
MTGLTVEGSVVGEKTVAFHTLGCKLNFSETSTLARDLRRGGFRTVDFSQHADLYVINTCSVTENAHRKCRKIIRQALRRSPDARVAVVGCYAQLQPEEIAAIPGVSLVLGAGEKFNLVNHVGNLEPASPGKIYSCDISHVDVFFPSHSVGDRTRAFLKVQDGCNYACSYCTIPLARGASRSDSVGRVVARAEEIASRGAREIVLTGVNIGDFGRRNGETFFDLIRQMDNLEGNHRIRISSIEPNLLSDDIIRFVARSKRFVPHFHIPLQSGSNTVLTLMRRRYRRELYADRVKAIKRLMPDCCIGADVIAGFPGEGREEFLDSYAFVSELDISYLHVFTYPERPSTAALKIAGVVSP